MTGAEHTDGDTFAGGGKTVLTKPPTPGACTNRYAEEALAASRKGGLD